MAIDPAARASERRGFQVRVLCISKGADLAADPRAIEVPVLKYPLLTPFAERRIWSKVRLDRPDLLHVLHDKMADVALALSERGQIPYVQTVAGFATVDRGLRLLLLDLSAGPLGGLSQAPYVLPAILRCFGLAKDGFGDHCFKRVGFPSCSRHAERAGGRHSGVCLRL